VLFFTVWLFEITLANFIRDSMLLVDPELRNSGLETASTCKATVNGLQRQTVHPQSLLVNGLIMKGHSYLRRTRADRGKHEAALFIMILKPVCFCLMFPLS